ncbi:type IV pilus biogenesis protein PilP [Tranquillimonas alkanivorans]|uniref:Type IV pilus biogenesis protein PilP n=1 Tax=Tranquillimonas alkanivorans TaxID=441119 RepID=A0A1I5V2E8_9RHOB|nr:type IV pilus biogenesis protein PilP [Tranquillimonas alkanivorans]SFQ01487.1 type IV pilus biogenesis protein PilP [Tranquillimonas alkanivorans]
MRPFVKNALITTALIGALAGQTSAQVAQGKSSSFQDLFGDVALDQPEQAPVASKPSAAPDATEKAHPSPASVSDNDPFAGVGAKEAAEGVMASGTGETGASTAKPQPETKSEIDALSARTNDMIRDLQAGLKEVGGLEEISLDRIDALSREKAFLVQSNEVGGLRLKALRQQIDAMLLLESTAAELRSLRGEVEAEKQQNDPFGNQVPAMQPQTEKAEDSSSEVGNDASKEEAPAYEATIAPMPELPRVAEIVGSAGQLVAYGDYLDGRRVVMRQGDMLASGLLVREVRPNGVRLKWAPTGAISVVPVGPRVEAAQAGTSGQSFRPGGAIPLGTFAE